MASAAPRMLLNDFNLANSVYALARVWVYEVDTRTWDITTRLAPVYQGLVGSSQQGNPLTLDSDGKWVRPAYVDRPVILRVTNAAVPSHDTGITGLQSRFMGDWAPGAVYLPEQIVRDGPAGSDTANLYVCQANHTATAWLPDLTSGLWLLYLSGGTGGGGGGGGGSSSDREYTLPDDFGAIGDGVLRTPRNYLGITTGAALRAYNNGVWSFAEDYDLDSQIDYLAIQKQWLVGGMARGRAGSVYKINRTLKLPNGTVNIDYAGCILNGKDFDTQGSGVNLLVNPSFDLGQTGWTQGTLTPRTNIVFAGGKASFTEPTADGINSYGDFGQQVTLPLGKWTIRLLIKMSFGVSNGIQGRPYINAGFRPDGVGLGAYIYPHPLSFGGIQARKIPFEGWVSFDVETLEATSAWLDIQGGNCDWEVQEAEIKPFLMNYMVLATGDPVEGASSGQYDVTTWTGGLLIGPVNGSGEAGWTGPTVGAILHKNFRGEGARCNFERLFVYGWDVGISLSSQAFLNYFTNVNIGNSRTCIKFLASSVNAGENFRVYSCIFFNSDLAVHGEGGGEWNFWGVSIDYCQRLMLFEAAAKVSMAGQHLEFAGSETRLNVTGLVGALQVNEIVTGATSGATAKVLFNRIEAYGYIVIDVLTGTFVNGETINGAAGHVVASGAVQFGAYHIELRGGSLLDFAGEMLQAGGAHRGAKYLINLESLADTLICHDWWAYGLNTASGTLITGSGRFTSNRLLGPGNMNNPTMFQRTHNADIFSGNGRLIGTGTVGDMGFEGPSDGIGLVFGAHSSSGTAASSRGTIAGEHAVTVDTGVYIASGEASLKLQMVALANVGAELRIYVPVGLNDIILDEYYYNKPDVKAPVSHGPYTTAATPNEIFVSIESGKSVATVYDNQAAAAYAYGPLAGWTVTFTNITGNPGGIANAVWNATHTIVRRLQSGGIQYTIDLGSSNIATSTSGLAGGGTVTSTYGQTNVLIFDRRFWVQVSHYDAVGRPVIINASFQAENTIVLPHAATGWVKRNLVSHYQEPIVVTGDLLTNKYNNGRAPHWATHYMLVWNWADIRFMDTSAPPPLYLTRFFGNRL